MVLGFMLIKERTILQNNKMANFNEPWNKKKIPTKEQLKQDRLNKTEREMLNKYNVSKSVLYRWFNHLTIPRKVIKIYQKECVICGNGFNKKNWSTIKQFNNKKTCSHNCLFVYRHFLVSGKNNPMYGKQPHNKGICPAKKKSICLTCSKEFFYNKGSSCGKYCSRNCYGKANRGENNHNFVGSGKYYRGSNWIKIRGEVRKRDNYVCQKCDMTNDECKLEFNRDLHIHHIVPYRLTKDNSKNNLISLCPVCHLETDWEFRKIEKGKGDKPK